MQGNSSVEPHPLYYLEHRGDFEKFPLEKGTEEVAVVDGVWMAMRKDLFNQIRFDDNNFHDFHLYDSDICMQVNHLGLDVMVTDKIYLNIFLRDPSLRGLIIVCKYFLRSGQVNCPS